MNREVEDVGVPFQSMQRHVFKTMEILHTLQLEQNDIAWRILVNGEIVVMKTHIESNPSNSTTHAHHFRINTGSSASDVPALLIAAWDAASSKWNYDLKVNSMRIPPTWTQQRGDESDGQVPLDVLADNAWNLEAYWEQLDPKMPDLEKPKECVKDDVDALRIRQVAHQDVPAESVVLEAPPGPSLHAMMPPSSPRKPEPQSGSSASRSAPVAPSRPLTYGALDAPSLQQEEYSPLDDADLAQQELNPGYWMGLAPERVDIDTGSGYDQKMQPFRSLQDIAALEMLERARGREAGDDLLAHSEFASWVVTDEGHDITETRKHCCHTQSCGIWGMPGW